MWMRLVYLNIVFELTIGCSIGTLQSTNVVVDTTFAGKHYVPQPERQEWATSIECIAANGAKLPPFIIFKGENLLTTWIPPTVGDGWKFSCNSRGWTSNYHGIKWLTEHFDVVTKAQLDSPDDYRLLLCDGHDSHISAEFVDYAIKNNIEIILLPPHSSHLLQPLDIAIFSPLKRAISSRLHRLMQTGISRLEKAEWLEYFAKAREDAITSINILSGWRGGGLFPQNHHRILCQISDEVISSSTPKRTLTSVETIPFLITSSPPDPITLHNTNQAFIAEISMTECTTPVRNHMRRLSGISERLQAENIILQVKNKKLMERQEKKAERQSGKRLVLKGKVIVTTQEVRKALADAEAATKAKKKKKAPRQGRRVDSSEDEIEGMPDDDMNAIESQEVEMRDCIAVRMS